MTYRRVRWIAVSVNLALAVSAFAQGPGPGKSRYDPATVATFSGVVQRVEHVQSPGKGQGVHLLLKTEKGELDVRLGPAWFVDEQPLQLAAQDAVDVRGSRIEVDGRAVILAAEIKKGEQVLSLRGEDGTPRWAGKGKRRAP